MNLQSGSWPVENSGIEIVRFVLQVGRNMQKVVFGERQATVRQTKAFSFAPSVRATLSGALFAGIGMTTACSQN